MIRLKEKLKAIYHIIIDSEYIVFTATVKDYKIKSSCSLISDNANRIFTESAIVTLERGIRR